MNTAVRNDILFPRLRGVSLYAGLEEEQLRFLATDASLLSYPKGALVCKKGQSSQGMFCLIEGKVKLAVLSQQGNERVVEIVVPGGTFGEGLMFADQPCPMFAETIASSELIFIRKSRIRERNQRMETMPLLKKVNPDSFSFRC